LSSDETVRECCKLMVVQDGGLGLFRLVHLLDAVERLGSAPRRIFSIGSGMGHHEVTLARLYPEAEVLAIDLGPQSPAFGAPNLRFVQGNILDTAFTQTIGQADLVYSVECLEHIPDDRAAFAAMTALVQPGGQFYIEVPYASAAERADPALREHEWTHFEHCTPGYDTAQLSEMANGSGLQVIDIAHAFWSPLQPMVSAAVEKFGAGMVTQWVENLLRLMQTDFRAEAAHNRFEALGIKMLCSKPL